MISEHSVPKVLHVLFYREEGQWLGHCLDLDLIEQGRTLEEAKRRIKRVARHHLLDAIASQNRAEVFRPAPDEFWSALVKARDLGRETFQLRPKPRKKTLIEHYRLTRAPRTAAVSATERA